MSSINTMANMMENTNTNEQSAAVQAEFKKDVCELTVVRRMGNPFFHDDEDLFTLETNLMIDSSVVQTLKTAATIGQT